MRKEDLFPDLGPASPAEGIRDAITRIRRLRSQVGHDGLTPAASRALIDEITKALEAILAELTREDS